VLCSATGAPHGRLCNTCSLLSPPSLLNHPDSQQVDPAAHPHFLTGVVRLPTQPPTRVLELCPILLQQSELGTFRGDLRAHCGSFCYRNTIGLCWECSNVQVWCCRATAGPNGPTADREPKSLQVFAAGLVHWTYRVAFHQCLASATRSLVKRVTTKRQ